MFREAEGKHTSLCLPIATRKDFAFAIGGVISKSASKLRHHFVCGEGINKELVSQSTTLLKFSN